MPDLSVATNAEIITELTSRETFAGLVLTVNAANLTRRAPPTIAAGPTVTRQVAQTTLQTALEKVEGSGL